MIKHAQAEITLDQSHRSFFDGVEQPTYPPDITLNSNEEWKD